MEALKDPCSEHDRWLKGCEEAFDEFEDADSNVVKLARMTRNLVTALRQRERDRVLEIIRKI